ncbi:SufE family protein [Rhodoferax sp. 4810]|uniref:SufE family protein n=1 Tax=Thiospirillum jenense TaxID=1653858 RepID=A0A839H9Y3_9GAMM|nr:SufE family protein [Thiospirillum jenense]MBB1073527.1 SufE family protein [Rhodoferax jenense]MBB1126015.1 SufE family protein [Thiospirillum jenense]
MLDARIAAIIDDFALLDDWEDRYRYLVELGEQLPTMPTALKTDHNQVKECMSVVHIHTEYDPLHPGQLRLYGDCDTAIIKGAVALLIELCQNKTPTEVEQLDIDALFSGLNLEEHLSPNRHVGVYAIVNKIKQQAHALV